VRANDVFVEHLGDSTFSELFKDDKRRELHEKNKALFYSRWGRRLKLLFIITKRTDCPDPLSRMMFSMARNQHIVYLWRLERPLDLQHINIRERFFPGIFGDTLFDMAVFFNNRKKQEKRYDMIFTDGQELHKRLSRMRTSVHLVDICNDVDRIERLAKEASRA
jgi:hypothetical protein